RGRGRRCACSWDLRRRGRAGVGAAAGYHYLGSRPAATGTARGGTGQPRRSHANGIRARGAPARGGGPGGRARTYLGSPPSPTRSSSAAGSRPSDRATTRTVPDCPGTARTIASASPLKALRSGEGKAVRSRGSPLSVATSVAGPSISKRTRLSALRMARPCASSTRRVMKDRSRPSLPIAVRSASSARRAGAPVVCTRASVHSRPPRQTRTCSSPGSYTTSSQRRRYWYGPFFFRPCETPLRNSSASSPLVNTCPGVTSLAPRPVPVRQDVRHRQVRPPARLVEVEAVLGEAGQVDQAAVGAARAVVGRGLAQVVEAVPHELAGHVRVTVQGGEDLVGAGAEID